MGKNAGGWVSWMQRLAAAAGSVMLVLSLLPTQGIAEAQEELIDLIGALDAEAQGFSTAQNESDSEAVILSDDVGASSDQDAVVAIGQAGHDYQLAMSAQMDPDEEQMVVWDVTLSLPETRLRNASLVFHAPGADLDGDGVAELYDEFESFYGVYLSGSKDDIDVEETDDGFEVTFPTGIGPKDVKKPVSFIFYTYINSDWYERGSKSERHTGMVEFNVSGSTYSAEAYVDITKEGEECTHERFHYEQLDTKQHVWCCDDGCQSRRKEDHAIVQNGSKYSCVCGADIVTVTYDLGGATGSMPCEAKVKGYDYLLPDLDPSVTEPNGGIFQGWSVTVGNGVAQKMAPGKIVRLAANTVVKAIWNTGIPYVDAGGESQSITSYDTLDQYDSSLTSSWYVASGNIKMNEDTGYIIPAGKTVNIVLCDGAKIELGGIYINHRATLNIFGQSKNNGAISSLGAIGISNYGTLGVYGGQITGATEFGIYNEGTLTLGDVKITGNNKYGVENSFVLGTGSKGVIRIKGSPVIQHNGPYGAVGTGVHLCGDTNFEVVGRLGSDARISVNVDGDTIRTFTKGYGTYNSATPPSTYFTSTSEWFKVDSALKNNEAVFFNAISYLDAKGEDQRISDYTPMSKVGPTLTSGWYVLTSNVTTNRLDVQGDVNIVLCEGATLNCKGIHVKGGNKLAIYAQVKGADATGTIISKADKHCAGIGGGKKEKGGTIAIYGGHIEAEGGKYGAGIGGGDEGNNGGENIYIHDGYVKATGGSEGAGIGAGDERGFHASIYIKGGKVEATGGWLAAGIGGGDAGSVDYVEVSGTADVYAQGGEQGAGIGGGEDYPGGNVKIVGSQCKVVAHGRDKAIAIGYGDSSKNAGNLELVDADLLRVTNDGTPCKAADRVNSLRKRDAVLEPCPHDGRTYTITNDTHTIQCGHCQVATHQTGTNPHSFNLVNRCGECKAKRMCFTFNTGGGSGQMDDVFHTATVPYELPQCPYIPPAGLSFEGWLIHGALYETGKTYTPSEDEDTVTVTASYSTNLTYVDKNGETKHVGEYTSMANALNVTLRNGWHVVKGNVSVGTINVAGTVDLLLCDGAELNLGNFGGLQVADGATINIYGQQQSSGVLKTKMASLCTNKGTMNVYGGKLSGTDNGINNSGNLLLAAGSSDNFKKYAVCNNASGNLMLGGGFTFNHSNTPICDIWLKDNTAINIVDDLTPQNPIMVRIDSDGVFTNGLKEHCPTLQDPSTIFTKSFGGSSDSGVYPELTPEGEAEIVRLVEYIDENEMPRVCRDFEEVKGHDRIFNEGWYVARGKIDFSATSGIHINGTVRFILADNAELKVSDGIYVAARNDADFHVYCQAGKSGSLVSVSSRDRQAAIGGCDDRPVGSITVHGGNVFATGTQNAAAIGGGPAASGGSIAILAGNVVATGGSKSAAIGGGNGGAGGSITIGGGSVVATGGGEAAAIGGGSKGAGGTIRILGGRVEAQAGTAKIQNIASEAIGHGAGTRDSAELSLYNTARTLRNGVVSARSMRIALCKSSGVTIEPCEHAEMEGTPTSDGAAHTISCMHCAISLDGELPHTFDDSGTCTACGASDLVSISFDPGTGSGTMEIATAMRNRPHTLPSVCTFAPPVAGVSFYKWSVDGKEYAKGATITPTDDLVVTALWNDMVPYVDKGGEDAWIGEYTCVEPSTTTLTNGWYVVRQNTTVNEIKVAGKDVKLLLLDDATLYLANAGGVQVAAGSGLEVYAQRRFHNGTIAVANSAAALTDSVVLNNQGTAALYGGAIRGKTKTIVNTGQLTIDGCEVQGGTSPAISNRGTLEVLDGEVRASERMYGIDNSNGGSVCVRGGEVAGLIAISNRGSSSKVTVTGGSVRGVSYMHETANRPVGGNAIQNVGTLVVDGGELSSDNPVEYVVKNDGKASITGGSIVSNYTGIYHASGTLDISGGEFETRTSCVVVSYGALNLSGNPSFKTSHINFANINLLSEGVININGSLDVDSPITVYRMSEGAFTNGYAAHHPNAANPAEHFCAAGMDDKYFRVSPIRTAEGEAQFMRCVDYVDENGAPHTCDSFELVSDYVRRYNLGDANARILQNGWFLVDEKMEMGDEDPLEIRGQVNLILADDASLTTNGVYVPARYGSGLQIWAQRGGTGQLVSDGSKIQRNMAGIGGMGSNEGGVICVRGGHIEAAGGTGAAGIGGGNRGKGGLVEILGGTIVAKGDGGAQAIGKGALYTSKPDTLILPENHKVIRQDGSVALLHKRDEACREAYATVEPCEHKGCYAVTQTGHTLKCAYCLAGFLDAHEEPHLYNNKGICECGKDDSVVVTYSAGEGSGTMEDDRAVRGQPYFLPTCSFTAPQDGLGIYRWQYGDGLYGEEDAIVPTEDVNMITALWNDFVPYIDEDGNPAQVGAYTNLEDVKDGIMDEGWYVVKDDLVLNSLRVTGEAGLVLCDGATLTINHEDGLCVESGSTLNIYGQAGGTGRVMCGSDSSRAVVMRADGQVNMYGGVMDAEPNAQRAVVVTGELYMKRGSVVNARTYGVLNKGVMHLGDGAIYGNYYGIEQEGEFALTGSPVFQKDGVTNRAADIRLAEGEVIGVETELRVAQKIVVSMRADYGVFTSGLKKHNPTLDEATTLFETHDEPLGPYWGICPMLTMDGEAAIMDYVQYVDENGDPHGRNDCEFLSHRVDSFNSGDADARILREGWYVVDKNLTISGAVLEIKGRVDLILADDTTLNAEGISVLYSNNADLHIWSQENGTGSLVSTCVASGDEQAGIGSRGSSSGGSVTIHGGNVEATGGPASAGIGGGAYSIGGAVSILNGTVIARGRGGAEAIGKGYHSLWTNKLSLYDAAKVTGEDGTVASADKRVDACRQSYARVEPCNHKCSYTVTKEGHTARCEYCKALNTGEVPHVFDDDYTCTVCGYHVGEPTQMTQQLILTGQIGLTLFYYLPAIEGVDYSQSYVEFQVSGKNSRTQRADFDPNKKNAKGNLYGFTFYVSSIEMAQPVTATLHYGDGQTVVGEGYTVENYIKSYEQKKAAFSKETTDLVHAIADYGHHAQPFLSTANKWAIGPDYVEMATHFTEADEYDREAIGEALSDYRSRTDFDGTGIQNANYRLVLNAGTEVDVLLMPHDGADLSNVAALFKDGRYAVQKYGGNWMVRIDNIFAQRLAEQIVVSWGDKEAVAVSALSYAGAVVGNSGSSKDAVASMCALYRYHEAAMAYLNTL